MLRALFTFFLLVSFLLAQNPQLQKAKSLLGSSKKSDILKAYNIYKSQYIKSLLQKSSQDEKIAILQGLIASAKKLGEPYREYQSELYGLIGNKKISTSKPLHVKKSSKKAKKTYKKPKIERNRLSKVILRRGYVEFYFAFPLKPEDISYRTIKKGRYYKNIYTIDASYAKKRYYRLKSVESLQILPSGKRVQIIFGDKKPITTKKQIVGNKLLIHLGKVKVKKAEKLRKSRLPKVIGVSRKVIVIDAGHGGKDTGAIGYKRKREKDIVLAVAKKLYSILKKRGYRVYMTRKGDYFVTLRNRTRFANRVKANLFISIHANAAPNSKKRLTMKGLETFFLSPARSSRAKRVAALENRVYMKNLSYFSKQVALDFLNREKTILSNKLAIDIQRNVLYSLRQKFKVVDGGVRPGPFWVLVGTQMPSILIEIGYITNPTEAMRLSNPYYQKLLAQGIASGIESYFIHNEQ